jgi:hypothetical protein
VIVRLATHKWWLLAFALTTAATFFFSWLVSGHNPDGLSGGTTLGLWTGLLATVCLGVVYVLPFLRRRAFLMRPTGPRQAWLRAHIWFSLLSLVFMLVHSGWFVRVWRYPGTLAWLLAAVYLFTMLTGVLGLVAQGLLPRLLTRNVDDEVPAGQLSTLCEGWRKAADADVDRYCGPEPLAPPAASDDATRQVRWFYERQVRPFLRDEFPRGSPLLDQLRAAETFRRLRELGGVSEAERALLARLEATCDRRRVLARQQRLHHWLHVWLLIHVPPAWAMAVLLPVHVVSALLY